MNFKNLFKTKIQKEEKLARRSSVFIKEMRKRKKEGTLGEVWEEWKWILRYTKKYRKAVAFYILTGIISSTFSIVSAVASKYSIDIITGHQTSQLWLVILIMVFSMVFSLMISSVTNRISTRISIDINNDIQAEVFDHIVDADWLKLSSFTNGDLLNRFNTDVSAVANNAINWLPTVIISVYQFVATFFVLWFYSPVMALIALSSAPILLLGSKYILKIQREYFKKVRQSSSKLMSFEVESFYNLDTIKSFGISEQYSDRLRDKQKDYRDITMDYNKYSILTNIFMSLLSSLVEFAAFGYCLWQLWSDQITYGTMTLFLQQRSSLTTAFNKVVSIIPNILTASVSAGRIRELLDLPLDEHIPSSQMDQYADQGFTVQMNNADFSYIENQKVIHHSDFVAEPGEIVALVGPSGEGKTTIIRLLLGLIHPQSGEVLLSSSEESVPMNADIRHLFAYVPQGNTILSGTIAENLRMVKEGATDEEIVEVLKQAMAWDFVSKMPEGIHSSVGEKGKGLSEGQAQRIAIARALLRNSPVLLLDEATSALDIATERKVLRNIISNQPNKTVIVTTHRPSVLNMCKRVYRIIDTELTMLTEEESARMAMDF